MAWESEGSEGLTQNKSHFQMDPLGINTVLTAQIILLETLSVKGRTSFRCNSRNLAFLRFKK